MSLCFQRRVPAGGLDDEPRLIMLNPGSPAATMCRQLHTQLPQDPMLRLSSFVVFLVPLFLLASTVSLAPLAGQDKPTPAKNTDATKDGGSKPSGQESKDPYGRRPWQLALLRVGPNYSAVKGAARVEVFKGHMANISRLSALGKIRLAGPLSAAKTGRKDALAGLFLFDVETRAEALELCKTDPAIKAGVFTVEVVTWYGPSDITYRGDRFGKPKTRALFNGKDLTGWHSDVPKADTNLAIKKSFVVKDGLLVSRGSPPGHLITDESFRNYRLVVEYRWPGKPGNCGILVHASKPRVLYGMFPQSIECQMHHNNAGDFWCIGEDIKVSEMEARRGPKEKWGVREGKNRRIKNLTDGSEKPLGEWNQMVIECRNNSIEIWVNGDLVNRGTACTASHGQIAIQAEGAVCEFRKVELTPLSMPSGAHQDTHK